MDKHFEKIGFFCSVVSSTIGSTYCAQNMYALSCADIAPAMSAFFALILLLFMHSGNPLAGLLCLLLLPAWGINLIPNPQKHDFCMA